MAKCKPIIERLERYEVEPVKGCHVWSGTVNNAGYGLIRDKSKMKTVHRAMYEQIHGEIPKDKIVGHTCHTKACVNPDHLELTTRLEKRRAMSRDGVLDNMGAKYKQPIKECPDCGKQMAANMLGRWHKRACINKDKPKI